MITGFNTDVDYLGRVFHVQTEDKGLDNPVVESLVYCGGEIIESRKNSYADLAESGSCSEEQIQIRMEAQHRGLIREIRNGRFDKDGPKPLGHNIISNRSLDEVVIDYLNRESKLEAIRLEFVERVALRQGERPTLHMRVVADPDGRPVCGAQVKLTLISTVDRPRELVSETSRGDGTVRTSLELPRAPGANLAVFIRASASGQRAVLREAVLPLAGGSGGAAKAPAGRPARRPTRH
jgi:hypothetical protein